VPVIEASHIQLRVQHTFVVLLCCVVCAVHCWCTLWNVAEQGDGNVLNTMLSYIRAFSLLQTSGCV
jgi:hypothetical protein